MIRAFCASRMASSCGLESHATTWPAFTESPSRAFRSTMRPAILEEISTVSPSIRPLTKTVPAGSLSRLHPDRTSRAKAVSTRVCFISSSLVISLLGRTGSPRQIRTCQPEGILGANARLGGSLEPVLRVHNFGIVGYALRKTRARKIHFLPRQLHIPDAGFQLHQGPLHTGDRGLHVRFDLRSICFQSRLRFPQRALRFLDLTAGAPPVEDREVNRPA